MSRIFNFISRLASLLIIGGAGVIIYSATNSTPAKQQAVAETETARQELLPPPPAIEIQQRLPPEKPAVWKKILNYLDGPCHPALESFLQAYDYRELRSSVVPIIKDENTGEMNLGAICDIFDYLSHWRYIDDPAGENMITPATTTWRLRAGDCDDLACVQSAANHIVGGIVRVTFGSNEQSAHAWCEVSLGLISRQEVENYLRIRYQIPAKTPICYREDTAGFIWLNLDWTATHPGGPYFQASHGATYYPCENRCETF